MNKVKFALPLVLAAFLFACKKEDSPKTTKDKMIGKWQITSLTADRPIVWVDGTEPTTNGYTNVPACVADDYLEFKKNNVFQENEGASKCDPNAEQVYTSDWSIDGNDLVIDGDPYTLVSVDGGTLKVTQLVDTEEEENVTLTLTLKKK